MGDLDRPLANRSVGAFSTKAAELRRSLIWESMMEEEVIERPRIFLSAPPPEDKPVVEKPESEEGQPDILDPTPEPPELTKQIAGGALDVVKNVAGGFDALYQALDDTPLFTLEDKIPTIERSNEPLMKVVRGLSQFASTFVPVVGMTGKAVSNASRAKQIVGVLGAGAAADFFAFGGSDDRVADLVLDAAPQLRDTPITGPLLNFLESDPEDEEAYGRFKNVVEGVLLGGLAGVISNPKQVTHDFIHLADAVRKSRRVVGAIDNERGAIDLSKIFRGPGPTGGKKPARLRTASPRRPDMRTRQIAADMQSKAEEFRRSREVVKLDTLPPYQKIDVDEVRLSRSGTPMTQEELAAYAGVREQIADDVVRTAQQYFTSQKDPAVLQEALQKMADYNSARAAAIGGASEAGRTLRAVQESDIAQSKFARAIDDIIEASANGRDIESVLAQISMLDRGQFAKYITRFGTLLDLGGKLKEAALEAFIATRFGLDTITSNFVSNTAFASALTAERYIAGASSGIRRQLGGKGSSITMREANKLGYGMLKATGEGLRIFAGLALRPSTDRLADATKLELTRIPKISSEAFGATGMFGHFLDAIGVAIRTVSRGMIAADVITRHIAAQGERHALAFREAFKEVEAVSLQRLAEGLPVTNRAKRLATKKVYEEYLADLPESLEKKARAFGSYAVFADNFDPNRNPFEFAMTGFQKLRDSSAFVRFFVPFVRTATRISQAGMKRMPLIGRLFHDTQEILTTGDLERQALSRAKRALGSGVLATALYGAHTGFLIGDAPRNPSDREIFDAMGYKSNSLVLKRDEQGRVVDSVPLARLGEPFNLLLRLYANGYHVVKQGFTDADDPDVSNMEAIEDAVTGLIVSSMRVVEDSVFFGHTARLLSSIAQGNEKAVQNWVSQIGTIGPLDDARRAVEPYMKEADSFVTAMLDRTPFGGGEMRARRDFLGQRKLIMGNAWDDQLPEAAIVGLRAVGFPLPFRADKKAQAIAQEIVKIDVREAGLTPTHSIEGVKLTPELKNLYRAIRGGGDGAVQFQGMTIEPARILNKTMKEALHELVTQNVVYARLSDVGKREYFESVVAEYGEVAKEILKDRVPGLRDAIRQQHLIDEGLIQ